MATRVTNFEVDTAEISERQFYAFPRRVQEMIRAYAHFLPREPSRPSNMRFRIAAYRWDEIEGELARLNPPVPTA